ncbi:MAG: electron transfer flavoprotein subunit alpha/FixB family protein [candidate division Zixibacteria bacterium]|nr:electron transfer flavoprotein subunit alpha/FixB family protein [candidate division Zixibacteria bacterium]
MKILTIADQKVNVLSNVSFEAIGAAKSLGGEVCTALLCGEAGEMANQLSAKGSKVFVFAHAELTNFNDEAYASIIKTLIDREKPDVVIGSATFYGKALMARLAALCGGGLASDCTGLSLEGDAVTALRPAYGGNVFYTIQNNASTSFFVTVRPKALPEAGDDGGGEVITETVDEAMLNTKAKVKERVAGSGGKVSLTEADIVVAAGRGIRGAENVGMIEEMADSMGAAFGASRAIVDAGWTEYSNQVGQTGKTVNPKLYIAIGISGAVQHIVGMRASKTIVAVNRDKDAPIFSIANYGIVGDLFEIVPALTKKFKEVMQ